jgi:2-oxoisovalerate dehydrogenase E1 component alpha subunit
MKAHLIARGAWSEERHVQAVAEIESTMLQLQKEAERNGTLHTGERISAKEMFDDVYSVMPPHLVRQRQEFGV